MKDERFDAVDRQLGRVNDRLDKLFFSKLAMAGTLLASMGAVIATLLVDRG